MGGGELGDVLVYNSKTKQKEFLYYTLIDPSMASTYTPIGVVVIPASHNVYGTGECGVMSLKNATDTSVVWGGSNLNDQWIVDVDEIPTLNKVVSCKLDKSPQDYIISLYDGESCIPSNYNIISSTTYPLDKNVKYNSTALGLAPSPYLTDGSRNLQYSQITNPSSEENCLAYFNGKENTNIIIKRRGIKDYNTWIPEDNMVDYPAASYCDMYYTVGTKQGDWYLPTIAELGYVIARLKEIESAISKITSVYGNTYADSFSRNYTYWSSTKGWENQMWYRSSYDIVAIHYSAVVSNKRWVRAFMRIKI